MPLSLQRILILKLKICQYCYDDNFVYNDGICTRCDKKIVSMKSIQAYQNYIIKE